MKTQLWATFLAAVAIGATSCSQDNVADSPSNNGTENGKTTYLSLSIASTDNAARAIPGSDGDNYSPSDGGGEWFNDGLASETAINPDANAHRILLFNADGSFYGSMPLSPSTIGGATSFLASQTERPDVPAQALVILNSSEAYLNQLTATSPSLSTVLAIVNESATDPESVAVSDGYFTMTSSVYSDNGVVAAATQMGDNLRFYDTEEEAKANPLTLYVERIVSKYTVAIGSGSDAYYFNETGPMILPGEGQINVRQDFNDGTVTMSPWKVNVITWGVNATEKSTYLFKNIGNGSGSGWNTTYPLWNAPLLHRSYWAIDDNYNSGVYPEQFRTSLNFDGVQSGSVTDASNYPGYTTGDYTLNYLSYNDVVNNRALYKYSLENTFDATAPFISDQDLKTKPYLRAGSHILVLAQLIVETMDADAYAANPTTAGFISGVSDKYFSNGYYWTKEALLPQLFTELASSLPTIQSTIANVLAGGQLSIVPAEAELYATADATEPITAAEAAEYFDLVPAYIKGGDGWVSLGLKDGVDAVYVKTLDGDVVEFDTEAVASYVYAFTSMAKCYSEGRMYYAIPVKQNIASVNNQNGINAIPDAIATGDFGVVRNHWYRFTINEINTVGTPVQDPEQPIIPNNEPQEELLGVQIEILPWHVVNFDNVVL